MTDENPRPRMPDLSHLFKADQDDAHTEAETREATAWVLHVRDSEAETRAKAAMADRIQAWASLIRTVTAILGMTAVGFLLWLAVVSIGVIVGWF